MRTDVQDPEWRVGLQDVHFLRIFKHEIAVSEQQITHGFLPVRATNLCNGTKGVAPEKHSAELSFETSGSSVGSGFRLTGSSDSTCHHSLATSSACSCGGHL